MIHLSARKLSAIAGLALAAALGLAACGSAGATGGAYGGGAGGSTTTSTGGVNLQCAAGASVCTKTVTVRGKTQTALADTTGLTLYYFTPDSAMAATCTGSCAQLWPPLTASGGSAMGTGLSGTLTTISDASGAQVVYNGHPLYRYSGDKSQSDATGEGLLGKWFVATTALAVGNGGAPASSPTNTPSSSYGGGY